MSGKQEMALPRRTQILTAAVEIFSEKGFHAARVEEIAQRAGIGKGTIYQYFTTKEGLFREVLQAGMNDFWQQIRQAQGSSDPLPVRLGRIASQQLGYAVRHRNMVKVLLNSPGTVSQTAQDLYLAMRNGVHAELVELFRMAANSGEIPPLDFDSAAWMMLGALNSLATTAVLSEGDFDPDERAAAFVAILFRGLLHGGEEGVE